jgi:hypothetical protein
MNVTHDANDREQAHVSIHVSEFKRVADWVLPGPPQTSQRLANHRYVRRIGSVAFLKDAPSNERDAESLEISIGRHTKIGRA